MFFLKFKTTVPSNNLFFKSDDGHAISRQEKRGCPKAPRDFPPRKDGILHSRSGCLGTSFPLPQSLYGRMLTSQPKFFGSIDYQISLAMELRWRALPAGSARKALIGRLVLRGISHLPKGFTMLFLSTATAILISELRYQ